jgi:quercetin dioxygenase-like cupin family protein
MWLLKHRAENTLTSTLQAHTMLKFLPALVTFSALTLAPHMTWAQAYPNVDLLSTSTTVVGEPLRYPTSGPAKVNVSIVTILPGADTVLHRHPAPLVAYILEGDMEVDYGDKGKRAFRKGDALVEAMDVAHRGMNTGTTPVKILAIYLGVEGTANVALEPPR